CIISSLFYRNPSLQLASFSGQLSCAVFDLPYLRTLALPYCSLHGQPSTCTNICSPLNSLKMIDLSHNNLTGALPINFAQCPNLTSLNLADNDFTGSVGSELFELTWLQTLRLSMNSLTGALPASVNLASSLTTLYDRPPLESGSANASMQ